MAHIYIRRGEADDITYIDAWGICVVDLGQQVGVEIFVENWKIAEVSNTIMYCFNSTLLIDGYFMASREIWWNCLSEIVTDNGITPPYQGMSPRTTV